VSSRLNGSMMREFALNYSYLQRWIFAGVTAAVVCAPVVAQGTHLWTQTRAEDFEKGTPLGVSIESDGKLREAPGVKELTVTPSTFVWSVAADKNGTAFVGTGSPATVLRIGSDGKPFTIFETKDLAVQSVRVGPDGALYVATIPSGKVYKLNPAATTKQDETNATVVFDLAQADAKDADKSDDKGDAKSRYVWDLSFDGSGRLYIATGGPGAVWRVDPAKNGAKPELFFKSDEAHIRALAWDAKGNLIAGSDGSGLVYRIDSAGKGYVLFEAPRREITAVAVSANGTIFAADVGDKSRNPLPPLPVQGAGSVTITVVQPGSMQAANASSSLPEGSEIYAIDARQDRIGQDAGGQAPRRVWAGKDEVVYALAAEKDGLLALTGNRGRVFRIREDGSSADIAHLEAQQGLALASAKDGVLIGTGNTGKVVALTSAAEKHEFQSDVLDAGALARFGRVEIEPGSTGYTIWTRSGNVEQPVRGWSEWAAVKGGAVASPAGRYLQWKVQLNAGGVLGGVGVNYLPVNSAPVMDDLVVVPGARWTPPSQGGSQQQTVNITFPSANGGSSGGFDSGSSSALNAVKDKTAVTTRWAAHDDNGDDLTFAVYLRGDGETVWRLLKDGITDKAYSFDQTLLPDGGYELKVVASDAPSHTPGDALTGAKISDRFEVDTAPPTVNGLAVSGMSFRFDAEDAVSPIEKAEYSLDAGAWQYVEPVGNLSDTKKEHYEITIPASAGLKAGEHLLTVRAYDRHDNVGVAKTVFVTR
jgi:WD40 repeat protein